MTKNNEFRKFEEDLKNSADLRSRYDEAIRNLDFTQLKSDSEIIAEASSQLGYDISAADIERAYAEVQELDMDEMTNIVGGGNNPNYRPGEGQVCPIEYNCIGCYEKEHIDADGHNEWCYATWHCYTAFIHTNSSDDAEAACWANYQCVAVYE